MPGRGRSPVDTGTRFADVLAITCPTCLRRFPVDAARSGAVVKCPWCRCHGIAPAPAPVPVPVPALPVDGDTGEMPALTLFDVPGLG